MSIKDLVQCGKGGIRSSFVLAKERNKPQVEGVPSVVLAEANAHEGLTKGQEDFTYVEG